MGRGGGGGGGRRSRKKAEVRREVNKSGHYSVHVVDRAGGNNGMADTV